MQKIVFFETEQWEEHYIKSSLSKYEVVFTEEKLDLENVEKYKDADVISVFIYSNLKKEVLAKFSNLKLISTRSTGTDHIDEVFAKEKNIAIANVPSYGEHTVSEHTFALILAISRKIVPSVEKTRKADFDLAGLQGFDLNGKTIGVLGQGHIGEKVIEIAKAFNMHVLVSTKTPKEDSDGVSYVALNDLLAKSDIVTLHLPLTDETKHIINLQNITNFKRGSILIKTARGGLVETQAVLEGLNKGILSAAGLDVLEEECNLKEERELLTKDFLATCDIKTQLLNHVLLEREDVIITPHNAFNSREALNQILEATSFNIKGFLEGDPKNLVAKLP